MIKNVKQRKLDLSKIQGFIFKFKLRPVRDAAYNSATIDGLLGFNRPLLKDFNYYGKNLGKLSGDKLIIYNDGEGPTLYTLNFNRCLFDAEGLD